MRSMTFKVTVFGDSYEDIVARAEDEIQSFLLAESDEDELTKKISYELFVEKDEEFDAEFTYRADVVARIK